MLRLPIVGKPARFKYAVSRERPAMPDEAKKLGYEAVHLTLPEGGRLYGVVRKPGAKDSPWLLFFPGNAEGQLGGALDLLERLRAGRDLGVATFNYRGFDGSDGDPSPRAAATDARAQLAYLSQRFGVTPPQLTVIGFSMGSGIALGLASESQSQGQAPRALVLLSPYVWLTVAPVPLARRVLEVDRYDALEGPFKYAGRTLVLAGSKDGPLPIDEHAQKLVKHLLGEVRYVELAVRDHVDYLSDDAALRPAIDFVVP